MRFYHERPEAPVFFQIKRRMMNNGILKPRQGARPKAHGALLSQADVPPDDNWARVTLDRRLAAEPRFEPVLSAHRHQPVSLGPQPGALELKFTNRFADGFGELARQFGLRQCSPTQYVDGVEGLERHCGAPAASAPLVRFQPHCGAGTGPLMPWT